MAATALDVLSLADAKAELRVEQTTEFDSRIEAEIGAAVDFVSRELGRPLLDLTDVYEVHPPAPAATYPIRFAATDVVEIDHVGYWTPAGSTRLEPDGTLGATGLGRVLIGDEEVEAWPPHPGWPETLDGTCLEVYCTRAFDTEQHPSVRHAVVCMLRDLYNGVPETTARAAVFALLRPWRRLARTGVSTTRRRGVHHGGSGPTPPPTPTHLTLVFGTSTDDTPTAAELTIPEDANGRGTIPAYAGTRHWLIWRLATEGDIQRVMTEGSMLDQIGAFTRFGQQLTPAGQSGPGHVWVSNQRLTNAADTVLIVQ